MLNLLQLALRFLKVGTIGFGGGSALIPIVRTEMVENGRAMSDDEFLKHTVVANITPGALPVKLGATCGCQLAGPAGSFLAACAVSLPGVSACILIIALFSLLGPQAIHYLNYASLGITVFIVFVLLNFVVRTIKSGNARVNALLCALALLATGGKPARGILELLLGLPRQALGTPLLGISMIHVMLLSFYLILYLQLAGRSFLAAAGIALALAYALACGGQAKAWGWAGQARSALLALFLLSLVLAWLTSGRRRGGGGARHGAQPGIWKAIALFLAALLAVSALAVGSGAIAPPARGLAFLGNILISALTSFGGGEAYVAVADSIFVQGGFVGAETFYTRIVPVANVLPGPILVKIAAAIGFSQGQSGGSLWAGCALALASAAVAVGACCCLALVVLNFYDALRHSTFVHSLKRYILPVICGTLLSTSLSMFLESLKVAAEYDLAPRPTFAVLAACVAVSLGAHARFRVRDIALLLLWVGASLAYMAIRAG